MRVSPSGGGGIRAMLCPLCSWMTPFSSFQESRFRSWVTNGADVLAREVLSNTLSVENLSDDAVKIIPRFTFPFVTHSGISDKRVPPPLRLCDAVAVHRSQGQTLCRVMLDLQRDPSVHGCSYVTLSRVRHSSDINILSTPARITEQGWV